MSCVQVFSGEAVHLFRIAGCLIIPAAVESMRYLILPSRVITGGENWREFLLVFPLFVFSLAVVSIVSTVESVLAVLYTVLVILSIPNKKGR